MSARRYRVLHVKSGKVLRVRCEERQVKYANGKNGSLEARKESGPIC